MFTKNLASKYRPTSILITGASSGIGESLALYYAASGTRLFLSGRNRERLHAVAKACRARGAEVEESLVDVCDQAGMAAWIESADLTAPLDLVIANAGISGGSGGGGENAAQARIIFDVNVNGVLHTALPALALMAPRGQGQIALMSSLASFSGWPGAPAYGASKGAVRLYGEALRGAAAPLGVRVNVICPGFVVSRMTDVNDFPMPFLMQAEKAAQIIAKGLYRNKGRIAFPWPSYVLASIIASLPEVLSRMILTSLPQKPAL